MWWGYFHCFTIVALLWFSLGSTRSNTDAAFALLVWFVLRQIIYEYNVIETDGIYAVMTVYMALCLRNLATHKHWFHLYLLVIGAVVCLVNFTYTADPYLYKTILGVLFQLGVLMGVYRVIRD